MSWNPLDWMKPITRGLDIIDQAVTDKDKANELRAQFAELREVGYQMELATKTVPWVDALHKMGRQINGWLSMALGVFLLMNNPEIDPLTLGAVLTPSAIYNFVKGKGR